MKKEAVAILKKTGKIACLTCITMGAIAVVTSGAALKSAKEGVRYLVEKSRAILKETDEMQDEGAAPEEFRAKECPDEEAQAESAPEETATEEI